MREILVIDPDRRIVEARTLAGKNGSTRHINDIVGGHFCIGYVWHHTGDVLFVADNGIHDGLTPFCFAPRGGDPLFGPGVVVGREIGDTAATYPPQITADELRTLVLFVSG